jgi:hypothetical protein
VTAFQSVLARSPVRGRRRAYGAALVVHLAALLLWTLWRPQPSPPRPAEPGPAIPVTLFHPPRPRPTAGLGGGPRPRATRGEAQGRKPPRQVRPPRPAPVVVAAPELPPAPADEPAEALASADAAEPGPGAGGEGSEEGGGGGAGLGAGGGTGKRREQLVARVVGGGATDEIGLDDSGAALVSLKEATALRTRDFFPRLPAALWREERPYQVGLRVCVSTEGRVSEVTVTLAGSPALDGIVIEAVRSWRYRPRLSGGAAVPFCHRVLIRYERAL